MNKSEFEAMAAADVGPTENLFGLDSANYGEKGSVNVYVCDLCGNFVVGVVRAAGIAPQMLPCPNEIHGPEPAPESSLSDRKQKRQIPIRDGTHKRTDLKRMPDGRPVILRSTQFNVPDFITADQATVELYRPDFAEYDRLPPGSIARHIERRGLWFRAISKTEGDSIFAIAGTENKTDADD